MKIELSRIGGKALLFLKENSPKIFIFLGIGGTVTGGVLACKATRKGLNNILDQHAKSIAVAKQRPEDKKGLSKVYLHTGVDLAKLYGPAATVELLSVASILVGGGILHRRTVALASAYAAVDQGFKDYRGRVVERFGEETDNELRHALHKETIESVETDENGKKKKVKHEIMVADSNVPNDYARYFAVGEAKAAEGNESYDLFYLRQQQELANHMLRAKGFLFLNDVYEMLGIDMSFAGQMVGWVYDKDAEYRGDSYIDFRIQEVHRKKSDESGDYEKVFLIDPNVDGNILKHATAKGLIVH